eukprot:m.451672 g.451672  ORF g.451672 m.451672 type:complete len:84 (-) comp20184_c0_seq1:704-955(-)
MDMMHMDGRVGGEILTYYLDFLVSESTPALALLAFTSAMILGSPKADSTIGADNFTRSTILPSLTFGSRATSTPFRSKITDGI